MNRNVNILADQEYDLLIIGGGINGVACGWEAILRGLRVAIIEKNDFGWATSSNSAKIAHSGMRYLQHADIKRMRESIRERNVLVSNAPHLIDSQSFLLPIYGHGVKGRETMSVYMKTYDLFSLDRQWFEDESRKIAGSRIISKAEVLKLAPGVNSENLTAGAIWQEGQMHNTERLLLSYVRAAVEKGAQIANYVEVTSISQTNNKITGVEVKDKITGKEYKIKTKVVLNATGPWMHKTLSSCGIKSAAHGIYASKAFSLLTRRLSESYALSFPIRPMYQDKKAVVDKGSSIQFAIPWRDCSLIGSLHLSCEEDPDKVTITEDEINTYIGLINEGYPTANLKRSDVRNILWGIIPAEEKGSAAPLKHYKLIDHSIEDKIEGLLSVIGVKYTTSRDVAQKAIDTVFKILEKRPSKSTSAKTPLWGGQIKYLKKFKEQAVRENADVVSADIIERLIRMYGSKYESIISLIKNDADFAQTIPNSLVTYAELAYAIDEEMAITLSDVVLRRTDLGSLECPADDSIAACVDFMSKKLGWDDSERHQQIAALKSSYITLSNNG